MTELMVSNHTESISISSRLNEMGVGAATLPYWMTPVLLAPKKWQEVASLFLESGQYPKHFDSIAKVLMVYHHAFLMGEDPITFPSSVSVINGKLFFSIDKTKSILARAGITWYEQENTNKTCSLVFNREGWREHTEVYSEDDFKAQGLDKSQAYRSYPKQLVYAQCFRRGAKKIAADILAGCVPADEAEIREIEAKENLNNSAKSIGESHETRVIYETKNNPPIVGRSSERSNHGVVPEQKADDSVQEISGTTLFPSEQHVGFHGGEIFDSQNQDHKSIVSEVFKEHKVSVGVRRDKGKAFLEKLHGEKYTSEENLKHIIFDLMIQEKII